MDSKEQGLPPWPKGDADRAQVVQGTQKKATTMGGCKRSWASSFVLLTTTPDKKSTEIAVKSFLKIG